MDTCCEEMMTALPNKLCSGNHKAREEGDHGILGKEIWSQKWEQKDSVQLEKDGGSWRQHWMEKSCLWPLLHLERQGIS